MQHKNILQQNDGYTLVEALVAIGILTSILLGVLLLATQSIRATNVAQSKLQAEYLAQEGIELVRALREDTADFFATPYSTLTAQTAGGNVPRMNLDSTGQVCFFTSGAGIIQCDGTFGTLFQDSTKQNRFVVKCDPTQQNAQCDVTGFSRAVSFTAKTDSDSVPFYEVVSEVTYTVAGFANPLKYTLTAGLYNVAQ